MNNGKLINKTNDGKTSQKMLFESCITTETSWVSAYNQSIASIDVSGKDAKIAPHNELCLLISEISKINVAEKIILRTR